MTQEEKFPGGIVALRKACQQLAKLKVKNMQEVVQAIEDEEKKELRREELEVECVDKPDELKQLKKAHREERRKGKLYIEALQKDQEIIFMFKLREAGLLW